MALYSLNGAEPAPLPHRIRLPDGMTRTGNGRTPEAIAEAGYVVAPERPSYDLATQHPPAWDGTDWVVNDKTQAEIEEEAAEAKARRLSRSMTGVEFMRLFTQAERVMIREAAAADTPEAMELADWVALTHAATDMTVLDPDVQAGVGRLVAVGLITEARAGEILDAQRL